MPAYYKAALVLCAAISIVAGIALFIEYSADIQTECSPRCSAGIMGESGGPPAEVVERYFSEQRRRLFKGGVLFMVAVSAAVFAVIIILVKWPVDRFSSALGAVKTGGTGRLRESAAELGISAQLLDKVIEEIECAKTEIERCRQDRAKYLEKVTSLADLAAAVAHEIKNPLAGISGALQVLAEDYEDDNPRKEIAHEILGEIGRLDASVKDFLAFARPPDLNLILVDINAIIERVMNSLSAGAAEKKAVISFHPNPLPVVNADPEQLEKAVLNIASYLLSDIGEGGSMTVETFSSEDDSAVGIRLSSDGRVLPEESAQNIFKPSFSTKYSRTGLRLAVSKNIVENHKGRLNFESRAGIGNRFSIFIPSVR